MNFTAEQINAMSLQELQRHFPQAFQTVVTHGVTQERDRATAHLIGGAGSGKLKEAIKAVEDGTELTEAAKMRYVMGQQNKEKVDTRGQENVDTGTTAQSTTNDSEESQLDAVYDEVAASFEMEIDG